jgi:hypothetical protein
MSKFQFLLISALITSAFCLFLGSRDGSSWDALLPVSLVLLAAYGLNRYLAAPLWEQFAVWANTTTGKRLFRTRQKRLPPSRSRRLS